MKNKIKSAEMWDERFDSEEYRYGKEANDFLKSNFQEITKGKVLCIGEGEGRNSVFLAKQGYIVTALDYSSTGLKKVEKLALENKVEVELIHADITKYNFEQNVWQGIVSIFCHIDEFSRKEVHKNCVTALSTNGVFLLEGYSPNQLKYATGGPKSLNLLMDLTDIKYELSGLEFLHSQEIEREILEGSLHKGMGSVIQIIGKN
jgi:2-polyprenyl-3-methyl-5-hydroxy-6-metoxy-1,4-benzoquinol methylase